jgi:hypothetical protein
MLLLVWGVTAAGYRSHSLLAFASMSQTIVYSFNYKTGFEFRVPKINPLCPGAVHGRPRLF